MNAWFETLLRASIEGGLLIVVVWAVTRAWSGLPAWARGGLWWMASARLLIGLLPITPLEVPAPSLPVTAVWWPSAVAAPPPAEPASVSAPALGLLGEPVTSAATEAPMEPALPASPTATSRPWDPRPWVVALLAVWIVGAGLRLVGLLRQGWRIRRMVRDAHPLGAALSEALAPGASIRFAASSSAPVPMVTGLVRPVVLLPDAMLERPGDDLRLAVAHEMAHVRRGDLWLAWVPALAEMLFWFHPLVSRCVREYAEACEEACDRDALRVTGASPYDYGRLLVAFGVHRRLAATTMPCGSPSPHQLKRRLSMLKHFVPLSPRLRNAAIAVVAGFALVGLAPLRVVPTSASPTPDDGVKAEEDADHDWDVWDDEWEPPTPPTPPTPPSSPTPPTPPTPPAPPTAPVSYKRSISGYSYSFGEDRKKSFSYVLVQGEDDNFTGSGSGSDWAEVQKLARKHKGDFMWARLGADRYLIEDPLVLAKIEKAFEAQRAIGEQQSNLGEVQSQIGEQQSAIGEHQSMIGEKQSEIGQRQAELAEAMAGRSGSSEFSRLSEDLAEQMEMLSREQERLSRRMEPLSRRQEELGAQMEALSRDMERISRESNRQVRSLIQDAIRTGKAKQLP